MGPVEVVVLSFPTTGMMSGITPVLEDLTSGGMLRIVDALVATQSPAGALTLTDLEDDILPRWSTISPQPRPLLSSSDADLVVGALERGRYALVLAIENTWADSLARIAADSGGVLELHVRVNPDVVEAASLVDS